MLTEPEEEPEVELLGIGAAEVRDRAAMRAPAVERVYCILIVVGLIKRLDLLNILEIDGKK